ncbi:hypothetical protein [Flavobacterium undicola]|uniref:hypothetical protein n=1 Tax=Flavobacterium undicola TaxID=1932779 RepID=UPI001377D093|nr:hypothetical protein [Flavobacterium undicola]MBA0884913.1 hypothetical protein [Flavobacterium undicola]
MSLPTNPYMYFVVKNDGNVALHSIHYSSEMSLFSSKQDPIIGLDGAFTLVQVLDWGGNTRGYDYNDFDFSACVPPIVATNQDEFFTELSKNFFSSSFTLPVDKRIVKFIKESNGNILLKKLDDTLITSFTPAQNIVKENNDPYRFRIVSSLTLAEEGFLLDYRVINTGLCEPVIYEENIDEFLIGLSENFFKTGSSSAQEVSVTNFPAQQNKFYKVYDSPQYRGNVYDLTNQSLGSWGNTIWMTQNVFRLDKYGVFQYFNNQHFDNLNGTGAMPTDWSEQRVLDQTKTLMLNGMYVKFTCTKPSFAVDWYHFRIFQDVRTNEVYITYQLGNNQGIYNVLPISTLECLDGGFSISDVPLGLKIEIRNKFF